MGRCWHGGEWLLATLLASGCAVHDRCDNGTPCGPTLLVLDCRPVQRGAIVPNCDGAPPRDAFAFNDAVTYCALAENEAQCLAATNASLARALEQEAAAIAAQKGRHHASDTSSQQHILHLQATQDRNRAAAEALQLYWRLAEAEGGVHNARRRSLIVGRMVSDVERLQAAGLQPPVSLSTIQAQQIELVHKQVDLEATIDRLNHQLVKLLGAEPPPDSRLWPQTDLTVVSVVPPLLECQQLALQQRADLCALRLAASANDPQNLNASRAVLGQSGTGLGLATNPSALFAAWHVNARNEEAAVRQEQLAGTLAEQERIARHDVAEAVAILQARVVQIGLSGKRLELLERQLDRLERSRPVEVAAGFEAHKARLDALAAEQDRLHDVIEWKIATVKLQEVQGELAIQCGFTAALECGAGIFCE